MNDDLNRTELSRISEYLRVRANDQQMTWGRNDIMASACAIRLLAWASLIDALSAAQQGEGK
jgi:hypothetical protein